MVVLVGTMWAFYALKSTHAELGKSLNEISRNVETLVQQSKAAA
jgi:hypothetical protein